MMRFLGCAEDDKRKELKTKLQSVLVRSGVPPSHASRHIMAAAFFFFFPFSSESAEYLLQRIMFSAITSDSTALTIYHSHFNTSS